MKICSRLPLYKYPAVAKNSFNETGTNPSFMANWYMTQAIWVSFHSCVTCIMKLLQDSVEIRENIWKAPIILPGMQNSCLACGYSTNGSHIKNLLM